MNETQYDIELEDPRTEEVDEGTCATIQFLVLPVQDNSK